MKLHYMGVYSLIPDSLPHNEHKPNAVPFNEIIDIKTLATFINTLGFIIMSVCAMLAFIRCWTYFNVVQFMLGCILPTLFMFPHEYLHAICFKKDVFLYTYFKQGLMFVVGPETMSKSRYIFMSLLPNILFGFAPYLIGMLFPQLMFLVVCGSVCIGMGAGDYYNVFNSLTQMPKGARTYMYKSNSFWYMP